MWSQELADYAELNVRRCQFKEDCHNIPEFFYSGQNLFYSAHVGDGFKNVSILIQESIKAFNNEKQHATQANIDNCCGSNKVARFLQMNLDKSNQIGCAIAQYTSNERKVSYLVCNYSYTLFRTSKVYESGSPTSKCQTGANPKYPALCSQTEAIDPNDTS